VVSSQFLAKPGAGRAQPGFLDVLEPMEPSKKNYEPCKEPILKVSALMEKIQRNLDWDV
jgi:hypothetical protein